MRGLNPAVSQCSVSFNHKRGTRRGMHYQNGPAAEAKLVRVIRGSIFDVMADMRPESPALLRLLVSESRDTMGTGPDAACSAGSVKR